MKKKLALLLLFTILFMPLGFNSGAKASEDFYLSDSSLLMTPGKTETITAKNGSLEAIDR